MNCYCCRNYYYFCRWVFIVVLCGDLSIRFSKAFLSLGKRGNFCFDVTHSLIAKRHCFLLLSYKTLKKEKEVHRSIHINLNIIVVRETGQIYTIFLLSVLLDFRVLVDNRLS